MTRMRISNPTSLAVITAALISSLAPVAHAAGRATPVAEGTRSDAKEIAALLQTIPTTLQQDTTLADRLSRLSMDVRFFQVSRYSADEVKDSDGRLRRGDVLYRFTTTDPTPQAVKECALWSTFSLVRRANIWMPTTKTANYLLNGASHCKLP